MGGAALHAGVEVEDAAAGVAGAAFELGEQQAVRARPSAQSGSVTRSSMYSRRPAVVQATSRHPATATSRPPSSTAV